MPKAENKQSSEFVPGERKSKHEAKAQLVQPQFHTVCRPDATHNASWENNATATRARPEGRE